MLKRFLKNEKGLTLIELLVVIVIMGIIAAIAVPAVGNIIDKTDDKAVATEALEILNAAKIDYTENGTTSWKGKDDDLSDYIESVDDNNWTASYDSVNKVFTISRHEANQISEINTNNDSSLTYKELTDYLER
ncbi:type II secretion system protein [Pseudalkalibacillus caeni]|uniref:Type II secretion system protein n=1 Tax=Exobacillus caeni TaxID=2574798 RepID=A0A5R9FF66_9BACL|nr:type II secretion system protein [Pseudalkalibacillus caeni]TLS39234.1 type II secretion system protein [Pseudalkalibacillus caeni]